MLRGCVDRTSAVTLVTGELATSCADMTLAEIEHLLERPEHEARSPR